MDVQAARLRDFLERLSRPNFILVMALVDLILQTIIVPALAQVVNITGHNFDSLLELGLPPTVIMVTVLVIAPLLETWLGQSLPFSVLYRLKVKDPSWLIGVSAVWFGLQHVFGMTIGAFIPGFLSGIILAYTFWHWRQVDYPHAFWMTAALHAAINLLATALMLIP
jgi:hypothetical protein